MTTAGLIATMAILPITLSETTRYSLYESEESIVERASVVLWIALAILTPFLLRSLTVGVIAAVVACLAFAAREAELHRAFSGGESVLKFGYYLDAAHPLPARLIAATMVGAVGVCIVLAGVGIVRRAIADGGFRASWVRIAAVIVLLAVASKVLDRAPALLSEQGVVLSSTPRAIMTSFEEIIEMLLPILVFIVILLFIRRRRANAVPC